MRYTRNWVWALFLFMPLEIFAFSFQGDVFYFRPTSSTIRSIYGEAWVGGKINLESHISKSRWYLERLHIFGDVSYLDDTGGTTAGNFSTQMRIVPISLGLKWCQPVASWAKIYVGAAPRYFFLHIKDELSVVTQTINKNGIGGMVILGSTLSRCNCYFVDLFLSYSFKEFSKPATPAGVTGTSLEVGGLNIGGGLGYQF